jgi:hypothetical protein
VDEPDIFREPFSNAVHEFIVESVNPRTQTAATR